ncbi:MAG: hydantoinase/oxoprolinase family protein, partial [Actinomycetia bacterium]|nr:hydantoinase/oxoprolinase family protein [Actinomycetes bacterium]
MQAQRFGLGVDTGGTYTDAVVYDRFNGRLVAKAKAATTPDDLAVGITEAIDRALGEGATNGFVEPAAIDMVALSTTLATNALVEGIGRPACLVTIGFQESALDRGGLRQALGDDEVIVVAGGHNSNGDEIGPLDLDSLAAGV